MCKTQPGQYLNSLIFDLDHVMYEDLLILKEAIKSKSEIPDLKKMSSYRKQLEDKILELSN